MELPIETKEYSTVKDYLLKDSYEYNPIHVFIKDLMGQGTLSWQKHRKRLVRRIPFRKENSPSKAVTRIKNSLQKHKYIIIENGIISITVKGKRVFEELKNRNILTISS